MNTASWLRILKRGVQISIQVKPNKRIPKVSVNEEIFEISLKEKPLENQVNSQLISIFGNIIYLLEFTRKVIIIIVRV